MADKLEKLAVDVRCVSEEDADLALEMAKGVRDEAVNAEAENARLAELAKGEAAREAGRRAEAAAKEAEARIEVRLYKLSSVEP